MEVIMEALPALGDAWALILQPVVLGYLVLGVVMGLCIGVFPGLGGIAGSVAFAALHVRHGPDPGSGADGRHGRSGADVGHLRLRSHGHSRIIGSARPPCSTVFRWPRTGKAARALSAAFASSLFGGLVGASFLTVFILIARPIVLEFRTPELLMITIFGLSMVGILAGRVAIKGLVAAGLGHADRHHRRRRVVGRSAHVVL